MYCANGTDRLLGHLAQFGSFWNQGELLCTQGLAYLLRDPVGERVFTNLIGSATGHPISPGLRWHAEARQADRGRPDLEGRNADGQAVVKIEGKLGASFGPGQLESYVAALCVDGQGGALLIIVPMSRREEAVCYACEHFPIAGSGPWQVPHETAEVACAVVTWEDVLDALSAVTSGSFQDDVSQLRAMYRVLVGDDMEPLEEDADLSDWPENESWWMVLADQTTRVMTTPGDTVLPFGVDGGPQPYRRRYVRRRILGAVSFFSIGTRDPFRNHITPLWLRFHKDTSHFAEIVRRLESSAVWGEAVRSQGHLWFPLEVPRNSDRQTMVRDLIAQAERIVAVAYPPVLQEGQDPTP